jgi:hypothetical protein
VNTRASLPLRTLEAVLQNLGKQARESYGITAACTLEAVLPLAAARCYSLGHWPLMQGPHAASTQYKTRC